MTVRAFHFAPTGQLAKFDSLDALPTPEADEQAGVWWVDVEGASKEILADLAERLHLDATTVENLRDDAGRARIDHFDDCYFLLLYGMLGLSEEETPQPRRLSVICQEDIVVTVHDLPLASIDYLAKRPRRIASQIGKKGVGHFLFLLLDKMVDYSVALAKHYEEVLEQLEDRSVEIDCDASLLEDLAETRREVLDLWRNSVAQRELLIELCEDELDYFTAETSRLLEHVRDHMTSSLEIVEILRGMIGDIRENYRATLSLRSAEAMTKLTVFAGLLLPLSVIGAIYGMNVPLWPNPELPATFWGILTVMATIFLSLAFYFRRQNWL